MQETLRPSDFELTELAQLVSGNDTQLDQGLLTLMSAEILDYHGIGILALEHSSLPASDLTQSLLVRRANMVAGEAFKREALLELFSAFYEAGLNRQILFKGTALAYSIYQEPWLRPRTDSDCLIDYSQLAEYESVFRQQGFEKLLSIQGKFISYQQTFVKPLSNQLYLNIDLHWKINNRQVLASTITLDDLCARAQSLDRLDHRIMIPHPVDSLLISSLHRLGHHHREERLIWLYDIHILIESFTQDDWQILLESAKQRKLTAITLDALALCRRLFESTVPGDVIKEMGELSLAYEPSQIFLHRDLPEWRFFLNDVKHLPSWASRLQLLRETFFPDAKYLKARMQTDSTLIAFVKRAARGLRRLIFNK